MALVFFTGNTITYSSLPPEPPPVELAIAIYDEMQDTEAKPCDVPCLIVKYAEKNGVDANLALDIAYAESRFKNVPNYKYDGEDGRYTAWGIFQFTRTTFTGFCGKPEERKDIEKNIDCATRMLGEGRLSHWDESKSAWIKKPYSKNNPAESK